MPKRAVFCLSSSEAQAAEIINRLKLAGFSNNDISALLPDKTGSKDFGHEHHTKAPEAAIVGGLSGGIVCAVAGWLSGTGILSIPKLATLLNGEPLHASLSAAAVGIITGGLVGALFGATVPEYEARRYAGKLRQANILLSIHCENGRAARRAKGIVADAGASNIATTSERALKHGPSDLPPSHVQPA